MLMDTFSCSGLRELNFTVVNKHVLTHIILRTEFRNHTSRFVKASCKYLYLTLMCFILSHPRRSAFALSVSRMMCVSSWYSPRISCTCFASASADTNDLLGLSHAQADASLCATHRRHRAASVPEHDSGRTFSRFHTTAPVTVARGPWARCLGVTFDKETVSTRTTATSPTSPCWHLPAYVSADHNNRSAYLMPPLSEWWPT